MSWREPFKLDTRKVALVIIFFAIIQLLGYLCIYLVNQGSSCQEAIPIFVRFPIYIVLGGWFASIFYIFGPDAWTQYWYILAPAMSLFHLVYLYILASLVVAFYDLMKKLPKW